MIVVDTNIVCSLYLSSERSEQAEAALRRDPEWAAPVLWRSELRNVLATYIRNDRLELNDAIGIMSHALDLMFGREYELASADVLAIAASSGCSAYDSEFVALAQDLRVQLVTGDKQVLAKFPDTAVTLDHFVG